MDFNYTPEQEAYRMEVRGWLEANQPPPLKPEEKENAPTKTSCGSASSAGTRSSTKADGPDSAGPKSTAGAARPLSSRSSFSRNSDASTCRWACNVLGIIMTGPALMQWGTEEQKQRYLKKILSADEIWCEGMSEPAAGSDLATIQTRAALDGDNFIVNGQKVWTTHAHRSHFCQLFVRTDPDVPSTRDSARCWWT